jgi:hypothetical protein
MTFGQGLVQSRPVDPEGAICICANGFTPEAKDWLQDLSISRCSLPCRPEKGRTQHTNGCKAWQA